MVLLLTGEITSLLATTFGCGESTVDTPEIEGNPNPNNEGSYENHIDGLLC